MQFFSVNSYTEFCHLNKKFCFCRLFEFVSNKTAEQHQLYFWQSFWILMLLWMSQAGQPRHSWWRHKPKWSYIHQLQQVGNPCDCQKPSNTFEWCCSLESCLFLGENGDGFAGKVFENGYLTRVNVTSRFRGDKFCGLHIVYCLGEKPSATFSQSDQYTSSDCFSKSEKLRYVYSSATQNTESYFKESIEFVITQIFECIHSNSSFNSNELSSESKLVLIICLFIWIHLKWTF